MKRVQTKVVMHVLITLLIYFKFQKIGPPKMGPKLCSLIYKSIFAQKCHYLKVYY